MSNENRVFWGPPGPWRDRFELLAVELRIAVLARAAGPYVADLYVYYDREGEPLARPHFEDEDAAAEYHRRRARHWQTWNLKVLALQRELDHAHQCHRSEGAPAGTTFYVSVRRGQDFAILAGPFATHDVALGYVDAARSVARSVDRRADEYAYGTCSAAPGAPLTPNFPDLHAQIVAP